MKAEITIDSISTSVLNGVAFLAKTTLAETLAAVLTVAVSDLENISELSAINLVEEGRRLREDGFDIRVSSIVLDDSAASRASDNAQSGK